MKDVSLAISQKQQRWLQARELFEEVLELEIEERERFLAEACESDPEILSEVETLLRLDGVAEDLLDQKARDHSRADRVGIARYRIEAKIGSGGMSDVYLGSRDDGEYRQQVAIKIIRGDFTDESLLQRFRNERQILADLEHANIARLLDGGTTPDGLPYLVIEYIEGLPLDQYCDRNQLSVDERLRLAREILGAVQYAHQNLVVHRDLKPGNILVTDEGVPKLLDFGIAKMLGPRQPPTVTQPSQRFMTPSYASPEQARGGAMTTATDVYSFGVVLYELLTGRSPYKFQDLPESFEEIICEQRPELPSRAVSAPASGLAAIDGEGASQLSAARGCRPTQLRRRLSGDLDMIVLKALRKEPGRRYPSAGEFALDLECHLRQMPVTARPDTFFYRTHRFVRRHRTPVALTCLFCLSIVLLTLGFVRALKAQVDLTAQERDRAQGVAGFLVELFQVSDLDQQIGGNLTARALLDRGAVRIAAELQEQPAVQATVLGTMGQIYRQLGMSESAESLLAEARDIWLQEGTAERTELGDTERQLGLVWLDMGQLEKGEQLLRNALSIARSADDGEATAAILSDLATLERRRYGFDRAKAMVEEAIEIRKVELGRDDPRVADSLFELGRIHHELDEPAAAIAIYKEVLDIRTRIFGDNDPRVASVLGELGLVENYMGDLNAAENYYRRSLEILRTVLGEGDSPKLAITLQFLGGVLCERGHFKEGLPLLRENVAILRRLHHGPSPYLAEALGDLGVVLVNQGELEEALEVLNEEREMVIEIFGSDHPFIAKNAQNLAKLHQYRGEFAEAEGYYRLSVDISSRHLPSGHHITAFPIISWASLLLDMGRPKAAEEKILPALALLEERLPADHWRLAGARNTLGAALAAQGRFDEAEPLLTESLKVLQLLRGEDSIQARLARARLEEMRQAQSNTQVLGRAVVEPPG